MYLQAGQITLYKKAIVFVSPQSKEKVDEKYIDYIKSFMDFNNEVDKAKNYFNKKVNEKLEEYVDYLKEIEVAYHNYSTGKGALLNLNNLIKDSLKKEVTKLIKKYN